MLVQETSSTATEPTPLDRSFVAVPLATLSNVEELGVDLYLKLSSDRAPALYRQKCYPIEPGELLRLVDRGVRTVFVPAEQVADYQWFLRENLAAFLSDERIDPTRRLEYLSETARGVLSAAFDDGRADTVVAAASELSGSISELVGRNESATCDLFHVLRHDYYTFTHSFNVAVYCALLARSLGYRDRAELQQIALAGLLHDLGKLRIPDKILTKPGRLTDQERQIVEQHPRTGFSELCQRTDLTWGQLMMVYQHHERLDGRGYPVGVEDEEIHPWAKLCSVVDIFEATTSNRPYRRPLSMIDALSHLARLAGTALDSEMVKCWIRSMKS